MLDALGIRRLSAAGYEADDIIATLATQAEAEGMDALIVTGDRDTFQLITDHVTVLYNSRGVSDMKRYDPAALVEKYGLTPAQYPDFAALRGDPSDNLPGIPGVGEKTATKWITEFGSLEKLVNRVDEVKGKAGDALREHLGSVLRNRQLTTLIRDLPDPRWAPRQPTWCRGRGTGRRSTSSSTPSSSGCCATGSTRPSPTACRAPAGHRGRRGGPVATWRGSRWRRPFSAPMRSPAGWKSTLSERTGLAVAGSWGRGTGNVTGIALAAPDGAGAYLDPEALTPDDDRALAEWLASAEHPKALHDAKGPMHALAAHGYVLDDLTSDTALAAYLALPGQRTFDLADLALRYLGKELRDDGGDNLQLTLDGSGEEESGARAGAARPGHHRPRRRARRGPGEARRDPAARRDRAAARRRAGARWSGPASRPTPSTSRRCPPRLYGEVKAAEQAAYAVVGHEFNLGSPKQLQEVLFTELGLPKTKRIKTGYTTDSEALTNLLAATGHPVLEHLLHHRDVAKLKSIVDSLIPMAGEDGRIHTTFNQMIAATGRLSSTDPNLQNIPIRTELGRRIRAGLRRRRRATRRC